MDKIYSRKRIRIPRFILYKRKFEKDNKNNLKIKKTVEILFIVLIAVITMIKSIQSIEPTFNTICIKEARSVATQISNNKATEVMKKYEYDDLATIIKDKNGNVTMVKSNIISINKIISDIAIEIQTEMDKLGGKDIGIKLGTFTGNKLLSGRGPYVKLRITEKGDVLTDYKSEFIQAGINQTLHRIYLEVKCNVIILTPFNIIEEEIVNQVILAENIIVGTTPSTYYNFDNLTNSEAVLESME